MLRLLHVFRSVNPKGGGPIEGVRQRSLQLAQMGHTVEIVSLDDPHEEFLKRFPITVHALGPSRGGYGYNPKLVPWLEDNAAKYHAVIVNGIWEYNGFAAWRVLHKGKVPYFVFTHGMLDPWFKRTYPIKHLKKWLYWPWATYRLLRDAKAVLFTSEEERVQARKSFWLYRAHEQVIAYGTSAPPNNVAELRNAFHAAYPELQNRRAILFLSRIHEKKGCDLLIRAFAKVADVDPKLHLVIAGPDQTGWVAELKSMANELGIADRICWPGMLRDEMKWGAFYSAEAFALPSHQENFGIAVAEALGCGLPVLISDKVNIWHEVSESAAGLVAPDTIDGTERMLADWVELSTSARTAMGQRARALYAKKFTVKAMADGLVEVIQQYGYPNGRILEP